MPKESLSGALLKGAEKVLSMTLREFVKRFKDLIPSFDYVMEDDSLDEVLKLLFKGKHFIIVLDKKGKLRGLITYLDIVTLFSKASAKAIPTAFGSIRELLKGAGVTLGSENRVRASELMERLPHWTDVDETVDEALRLMRRDRYYHTVIKDREGMVYGVLTYHSIFRAIIKQAGLHLPQEKEEIPKEDIFPSESELKERVSKHD
ncbi:MAG: CBS domain-containing protein [Desulfurococcales archaeon]|nr:CBS domain-containing protein [Desulfurococcales archaeon]